MCRGDEGLMRAHLLLSFAVIHQRYDLEVQNPGGFIGSNVIIKCNIPQFVKEYVRVTSWLEEPLHNIYPSLEGDAKFHMLPSGELIVINVTRADADKTFRCRTLHSLTQDVVISSSVGRIQLTGEGKRKALWGLRG